MPTAVAPSLGKMTCLILPYANTKMMNLFVHWRDAIRRMLLAF